MNSYSLTHLSDAVLLRNLRIILARNGQLTAALLAYLGEFDARRLYAPAGFSSMFTYCLRELRFAEGPAWRRIQAARAARRFPVLFQAVAEGRIHLTAVCLIAPHLTPGNINELLRAVGGRSRAEVQEWLASRFPQASSVPPLASIRPVALPLPKTVALDRRHDMFDSPAGEPTPEAPPKFLPPLAAVKSETTVVVDGQGSDVDAAGPAMHSGSRNQASTADGTDRPSPESAGAEDPSPESAGADDLSPEAAVERTPGNNAPTPARPPSFLVQVTVSKGTHDKLRLAQALLSHAVSPRDVAQVLDRALDALIEKLEKRKFGRISK
ncbi:MAG TPA: hypothetical protein VE326_08330 [Candidatus Binatia bacterium]|nr:hypothetical protein [Candidatus Binatia bacterium]